MAWLKPLADTLTALRGVLSLALAGLGSVAGSDGLNAAACLLLAAWTTDALDGPLARKSGVTQQSWIGQNDLIIDLVVAVALLHFMRSAGLVHPLVVVGYIALWGVILWRCGSLTKPLGAAFQGPVYVWFGVCLLARKLLVGRVMVAWVLANLAVKWEVLTTRELPHFLQGMRQAGANLLGETGNDAQR
ncbi:MAG TPA: hypothetical protein GX714_13570 [Chloroflexi bacterium]|jgi:phosphatidylglycerophosphate synthase|nr:hypothetical protein [Chloroflexota bacterium]